MNAGLVAIAGAALLGAAVLALLWRGAPPWRWRAAVAFALPLLAAGLALAVGQPALLLQAAAAGDASAPHDVAGWRVLAQEHEAARRLDPAIAAWRQALVLRPDDAELMAHLAVTLAMRADGRLAGEPAALIDRALALAPEDAQLLSLAGSVRFEAGDAAGALQLWRRVQARLPAADPMAATLAEGIAAAERLAPAAPR